MFTNPKPQPSQITGTQRTGMEITLLISYIIFLIQQRTPVSGHLPDYAVTPSNKIEQFCAMADTCIHDTIPICGRMGEEKRTFMDLCDLLEYACDTNQVFTHVEDIPGCPKI